MGLRGSSLFLEPKVMADSQREDAVGMCIM